MISFGDLLVKSFYIFKKRFLVFVAIMLVPFLSFFSTFLFVFLPLFIFLTLFLFLGFKALGFLPVFILMFIFSCAAFLVASIWTPVALICAVLNKEDRAGIKEAFDQSFLKIFSYWWIAFLNGLFVIAGLVLFIIPGIIFGIWFFLSEFVLISEGPKGKKALFRSKNLIKGYWWQVFWRIALLNIIIFSLSFALSYIPFVNNIIFIFITPFSAVFGFLIYKNLKYLKSKA